MMSLSFWLPLHTVDALGQTLIQFLWQGFAVAAVCHLALAACRGARLRYMISTASLAVMALCPVATFVLLQRQTFAPTATAIVDAPSALDFPAVAPTAAAVPWSEWLVAAWFAGIAVLTLRIAGGWLLADRLRRQGASPLPADLAARCERLYRVMAISRPVRFLQSAAITAPIVVGWLRPVVLIPFATIVGLTPAQLDAVIAHELAHIRRLDALANLLQMAVETVLFYHPAVWWVSRRIRIERENCCDDIAVSVSGDALNYAKALAAMEEGRGFPAAAMAATGGLLMSRITRLLGVRTKTGAASMGGIAIAAMLGLAGCVAAHGATTASTTQKVASAAPAAPPAPPVPTISAEALSTPVVPLIPAPPINIAPSDSDTHSDSHSDRDEWRAQRDQARAEAEKTRAEAEKQRQEARAEADRARKQALAEADVAREEARAEADAAREQALAHMRETLANLPTDISQTVKQSMEHAFEHADMHGPGFGPLSTEDQAYRDALQAAGLHNLSPSMVRPLKTLGVTPDYVRSVSAAWPSITVSQLVAVAALKVNPAEAKGAGLTPEFLVTVRNHRFANLSVKQLVALKNTGVL